MAAKIGKLVLLAIGILMILSVTVFDPAEITETAKRWFGLQTGPRADRDIQGIAPTSGRDVVEDKENAEIRRLVEELRIADTRGIIEHVSTLPESRVVGYQGNEMAAQYVEDVFRSIGLENVTSQPFEVTVPVDDGSGRLEFADSALAAHNAELFCLWPNEVRTSTLPEGFSGVLVDGGKGQFAHFNGKRLTATVEGEEVADAIALLDFDCGQDWMSAAMIGAKAILFFDNSQVHSITVSDTGRFTPAELQQYQACVRDLGALLKDQAAARDKVRALLRQVAEREAKKPEPTATEAEPESPPAAAEPDPLREAAGPIAGTQADILARVTRIADGLTSPNAHLRFAKERIALVAREEIQRGVDTTRGLAELEKQDELQAAYERAAPEQDAIVAAVETLLGRVTPAVTRGEAEQKFIGVPANIPRFWVTPEDGRLLRRLLAANGDRELRVSLSARMTWKRVKTRNILGTIPGTLPEAKVSEKLDYKRQRIIVLSAFYDAMSVVPRLAPGAENACGLAALLQTARVLKKFPPRHTVVFLATSSHFHCLSGVQEFLADYLPTGDELDRPELPRRRVDFDIFIGLDLTSHHHQVATTCFGTFFSRHWDSNVYLKNLLAPYAKKLTEYAARIFRKSTSEATCPHINAITPPKKTWKNFVPRPVAFDAEAVVARGKDGITLFTPHDLRNLIDTPSDTLETVDIEKLHTQIKAVAAVMAKAGRDVQFFTDSKLRLQNRINYSRGNVTWFDRALNPNIPKAPIGGAVVTFRHPAADVTSGGVRTLYTATSRPANPHGGDDREGFYVNNVTLNSRRVTISAWSDQIGEVDEADLVIQSHKWLVHRRLERVDDGQALIQVAERFVLDPDGSDTVPIPSGEERGRWEPAPGTGKRMGRVVGPSAGAGLPPGHGHIRVGNAHFRGPILVPPVRFELDVDLSPPGWLQRWTKRTFAGQTIEQVELAPDAREVDPQARIIRSIVLTGSKGAYEIKDVDVAFGQFAGQFVFPYVQFWQWGAKELLAYKLDEDGAIVYAQDQGSQGKDSYPNDVKYGGGAQCVLFRCCPMTILEIVDSRYMTVLDEIGVLGTENSVPQQWGARFIPGQSRAEGLTTSASVVFARYDALRDEHHRLKIHMGTGLYRIKLLLTNAQLQRQGRTISAPPADPGINLGVSLDEARGTGYPIDGRVLLHPTHRVAWDMWVLNEYRLRELKRYGISNTMLEDLHNRARVALLEATKALDRRDYEKFIAESRRAWGFEAKAYPDVASQADDTVKGVVFYFVLLIPFAFFMERLLIGAADIRKRILWFAIIFLIVFAVLRLVHPAFKLSSSPYIILLAFVILAMGVIVLFIVVNKFNQEIRKMKQAAHGVQQADVGRLSASYAAVMLGISNLRKRKIRTTLTAVTLTLLTFTVLSFTSISKSLYLFRLSRSNVPSYQGGLVRDRNWRGQQAVVLDYLRSEFGHVATIAPRTWLISKMKGEKEFFEFAAAGGRSNVNGIVGLTPDEVGINPEGGPQTMLIDPSEGPNGRGSRWFRATDRYACILPDDVAARVGITPEHIRGKTDEEKPLIRMLGHDFRVIGLIDSKKFNAYKDIDDEKLTPVDTLQEASRMNVQENPDEAAKAPIQAFTHMESSNSMLVPYDLAMDVGGTLRSIAISNFENFVPRIRKFMERVALNIFVAQGEGEDARVEVLSSMQTTSFSGIGNLFIPILIAALIVLNTMMGAVYERFHEIHIYSSVGLAPTHIAALFLAESAVFATVGAVAGYLIGQTVSGIIWQFGWMGSLTLNYSSLSAIYSSVVVMLTVFLSTLYPAKKASDMAVPDVTRRWEFPPPKGDNWEFDFPFTVGGAEILGMYCYLARFLQSYGETSIGAFYTEDVELEKARPDEPADYRISARCWLAPYDLGISQDVHFEAVPTGEHAIYRIVVTIRRISGDTLSWQRMNRGFLNVLRKQFLVWRTVPSGTKLEYTEEGQRLVGEAVQAEAPAGDAASR